MKTFSRFAVLFSSTALAGLIYAQMHETAGAAATAAPATVQAAVAQAVSPTVNSPPLVNLPDFSRLVDRAGPAVVNIEATIGRGGRRALAQGFDEGGGEGEMPGEDELPEVFKRFFGPGGPGQMPQQPRGGTSFGSGFIISADGYVLTNHHVVEGADTVRIKLSDRREFTAKVVGSDEQSDVALLKIAATGLPTLRVGDSKALKSGQWVVAIGSPFGLDHSVTAGIVSAVGRANPYANQRYVPFIQTDVAINRGNSGGPLLDTRGQVVGINSQIFSNSGGYMGVSFAIPIDVAMNAVQQLKATGKVTRGQLGVVIQPFDRDDARAMGLPDTRGALVNNVQPGSPAARAGIQRMDVIRSINGQPIYESSDLPPIVGAMAPGSKVTVELLRDGKPRTVSATLNALDERVASAQDDDQESPRPADEGCGARTAPPLVPRTARPSATLPKGTSWPRSDCSSWVFQPASC